MALEKRVLGDFRGPLARGGSDRALEGGYCFTLVLTKKLRWSRFCSVPRPPPAAVPSLGERQVCWWSGAWGTGTFVMVTTPWGPSSAPRTGFPQEEVLLGSLVPPKCFVEVTDIWDKERFCVAGV